MSKIYIRLSSWMAFILLSALTGEEFQRLTIPDSNQKGNIWVSAEVSVTKDSKDMRKGGGLFGCT